MPMFDPIPGLDIQAVPSRYAIEGVATSIALFIGRAQQGPLQKAVRCESWMAFETTFSGSATGGDLPRAVRLFFNNGGTICYVIRLLGEQAGVPKLADYLKAYALADCEVDLFNVLILPHDQDHDSDTWASLWGPASAFAQKRRALLLVDPPQGKSGEWGSVADVLDPGAGVSRLRPSLVQEYCAVYYPLLKVLENGVEWCVGPSGAVAGIIARMDANRGAWKSPAGMEASVRGASGLSQSLSAPEHDQLNPHGINAIRMFTQEIVVWGARTLAGDDQANSEDKYIAIRRMAMFLEESLSRGLQWTIFEPNDEPLWAWIRLEVGIFLETLFRQGAFQGSKNSDAYYVKCNAQIHPVAERASGRLHVEVGFAPLKPAEFICVRLQFTTKPVM